MIKRQPFPPINFYQAGTIPSGAPILHPVVLTMVDPPVLKVTKIRKSKHRPEYPNDHPLVKGPTAKSCLRIVIW